MARRGCGARVAWRAARLFAALLGEAALVCVVAERAGAQGAPAKPLAVLEALASPGDAAFTCRVDSTDVGPAFDLPAGTVRLLFHFGAFPLDDREVHAMLDSSGRVLAVTDAVTLGGGGPDYTSVMVSLSFEDDGSVDGIRLVGADSLRRGKHEQAMTIRTSREELTEGDRKRARALAAWIAAHRCDRARGGR